MRVMTILICAATQGDENAFNDLVRRHRCCVLSLLRPYVDHREQAEDLTQEVFSRVYRARDQYRGNGKFAGWLKKIAVNLARDYIRKQKRNPFVDAGEDIDENRPHPDEPPFDPMAILNSHVLHQDLRTGHPNLAR
jgi:RNA polymerase sigma factor (sigma-70 family)